MEKEKSSLTRLIDNLRHWKWLSVLILAFLGVVFILTSHVLQYKHHEVEPVSPSFLYGFLLPTLSTLGLAILSGGIFTFLLKTAEYNDLFKNEIRAVVLSDDVLLHKRDQLRRILLLEDGVELMAESYREQVWHKARYR
jgi:hypothetical protein